MLHGPFIRAVIPLAFVSLSQFTTSTLHPDPPAPDAVFDYVIIGGGTAGLPLAARLSEPPTQDPSSSEEQKQNTKRTLQPIKRSPEIGLTTKDLQHSQQQEDLAEAPDLRHGFEKRRVCPGTKPPFHNADLVDTTFTDPIHLFRDKEPPLHDTDVNNPMTTLSRHLNGCLKSDDRGDEGKGSKGPTVAVLESGQSESDNPLVMPAATVAGFGKAFGTRVDWGYQSEKQADMDGSSKVYYAGKGLGGTSLINGKCCLLARNSYCQAYYDYCAGPERVC